MTSREILSYPLYQRARRAGQEHIFRFWFALSPERRDRLIKQVERIDFDLLEQAVRKWQHESGTVNFSNLEPLNADSLGREDLAQTCNLGEKAIRRGEVCSLVLAGGQGTRLGYPMPKGCFPIGPLSGKSLFAWFAEKIRFFEAPVPWLVMTSPVTDKDTRAFFEQEGWFGLSAKNVWTFQQGMLPNFDFQGRLLMDAIDHICESPNGHGGVVEALGRQGLFDRLEAAGVRYVFIHNVDNCLAKVLDPAFVGYHISQEADFSLKCLTKRTPEETLGVLARSDGKIRIIEYSDFPVEIAARRVAAGDLVFATGSINIYMARVDFLKRIYHENRGLPYHYVQKRVPAIDRSGQLIQPVSPNGIKLESKLFDLLQFTNRASFLMTDRVEEFSPLKSGKGEESYDEVQRNLFALFASWFADAGLPLPLNQVKTIEVSPLFAVDRETFRNRTVSMGLEALRAEVWQQIEDTGSVRL